MQTDHSALSNFLLTGNTHFFHYLILLVMPIWLYSQAASYGYIAYDDPYYVELNQHVIQGMTLANVTWAFKSTLMQLWHPLTWLSYQVETSLFGADNAAARHITNISLHTINVIVVYKICAQLKLAPILGLWVALIFAAHPQHVQNVAWISSRKELLSAMFSLISIYFYIFAVNEQKQRGYFLCALFFFCALLSKPTAVTLPLLLATWHITFQLDDARIQWRVRTGFLLSLISMSIAVTVITILAQKHGNAPKLIHDYQGIELVFQWASLILMNLAFYLKTAVIPLNLALFVEAPNSISLRHIVEAFTICSLFFMLVWRFWGSAWYRIGAAWFMLYWLPISGIIPIGPIYVADRYSYQPLIGLSICFVCLLDSIRHRIFQASNSALLDFSARLLIKPLILMCLACLTLNQLENWRSNRQLFEHENMVNPNQAYGPLYLGIEFSQSDSKEQALEQYSRAVALKPKGFYPYYYRAQLYETLDNSEAALEDYLKATQYPNINTKHYGDIAYQRAVWLLNQAGRHQEAIQLIKQGLETYPDESYLLELQQYYLKFYEHLSN